MNKLIKDVENWFVLRGLAHKDGSGQLIKLQEEVQELIDALEKQDRAEEIDAVGDITVVLIGYCLQRGYDFYDCLESAYNVIRHRTGKVNEDGVFVKDE